MSFTNRAKLEIINSNLGATCCQIAEISALIRTCAQIETKDGEFKVTFSSDIIELTQRIRTIIKNLINKEIELTTIVENNLSKKPRYNAIIKGEDAKNILEKCYIIKISYSGQFEMINGISKHIASQDCCMRRFIMGAFMGCASANIKIKEIDNVEKRKGGYHLEFVFSSNFIANDFLHLTNHFDINLKLIRRKKNYVCYLKEMDMISDLLALVGASGAVLTLQNELTIRQVRNDLNRQLNCLNANIGKTVDASIKQLEAINIINQTIGLESLPDNLQDLCLLRLANPEESMQNLVDLTTNDLTKSGINHRLRKIIEIAKEIKKSEE